MKLSNHPAGMEAPLAQVGHRPNRLLDGTQQRIQVVQAVVAYAVDKEGRRAVHAAADAAHKIFTHASGIDVPGEFGVESVEVEAERGRMLHQSIGAKRLLVLE